MVLGKLPYRVTIQLELVTGYFILRAVAQGMKYLVTLKG
jgi:hypothetical protein